MHPIFGPYAKLMKHGPFYTTIDPAYNDLIRTLGYEFRWYIHRKEMMRSRGEKGKPKTRTIRSLWRKIYEQEKVFRSIERERVRGTAELSN